MPKPNDSRPKCPTCKGKGYYVLLISRADCKDCNGTGVKPPPSPPRRSRRRRRPKAEESDRCDPRDHGDGDYGGGGDLEFDDESAYYDPRSTWDMDDS